MAIDPTLLRRSPLFAELSDKDLKRLAADLHEHRHEAGDVILSEGGGAVGFFVLLEGSATVDVAGDARGTLQPGAFFGEIGLLDEGQRRTATVTAAEPTLCAAMTAWEFKPFLASHPDAAFQLMRSLARRVADEQALAAA